MLSHAKQMAMPPANALWECSSKMALACKPMTASAKATTRSTTARMTSFGPLTTVSSGRWHHHFLPKQQAGSLYLYSNTSLTQSLGFGTEKIDLALSEIHILEVEEGEREGGERKE